METLTYTQAYRFAHGFSPWNRFSSMVMTLTHNRIQSNLPLLSMVWQKKNTIKYWWWGLTQMRRAHSANTYILDKNIKHKDLYCTSRLWRSSHKWENSKKQGTDYIWNWSNFRQQLWHYFLQWIFHKTIIIKENKILMTLPFLISLQT